MDSLSYKTISINKKGIKKNWLIIDAQNKTLGRLASEVAIRIRGKRKTNFTPHVDCGDNVIVINSSKINLTGKKWKDKMYIRHTGYPGGQRSQTPLDVKAKYPNALIERAVKGMLPKNRLGRAIFKNLYLYENDQHPHQGQLPVEITL